MDQYEQLLTELVKYDRVKEKIRKKDLYAKTIILNIVILDLSGCNLTELPANFDLLINLRILD